MACPVVSGLVNFTKVGKPTISTAVAPAAAMAVRLRRMNTPVAQSAVLFIASRTDADNKARNIQDAAPMTVMIMNATSS